MSNPVKVKITAKVEVELHPGNYPENATDPNQWVAIELENLNDGVTSIEDFTDIMGTSDITYSIEIIEE